MARLFVTVTVVIAVFVCSSNIVQCRNVFQTRQDKEVSLAESLTAAGVILLNSPPEQVHAFNKAIHACLDSNDKDRQRKFILKSLDYLTELMEEPEAEASLGEHKRDNPMSKRHFDRRGDMEETMETLTAGSELLKLLTKGESQKFMKAHAKFLTASASKRSIYMDFITKYANECGNGEDAD